MRGWLDCAESAKTESKIQDLEKRAKEAMHLPEDHRVRFTDLHDALTSMRFHGKQIPEVQPTISGQHCTSTVLDAASFQACRHV